MATLPEINCPACGQESWLLRKPKYDGFKKIGETLTCASCGFVFPSEAAVPFKIRKREAVFSEADRPKTIRVFDQKEIERLCRHCAHYTVNPFVQWCGLHRREVEATDTCPEFAPRGQSPKPVL